MGTATSNQFKRKSQRCRRDVAAMSQRWHLFSRKPRWRLESPASSKWDSYGCRFVCRFRSCLIRRVHLSREILSLLSKADFIYLVFAVLFSKGHRLAAAKNIKKLPNSPSQFRLRLQKRKSLTSTLVRILFLWLRQATRATSVCWYCLFSGRQGLSVMRWLHQASANLLFLMHWDPR